MSYKNTKLCVGIFAISCSNYPIYQDIPAPSAEIPISSAVPVKQVPEIKIPTLSTFETKFNSNNKNRSYNIQLAAGVLNKLTIPPGSRFSFNETVGPRTKEKGYLKATQFFAGTKVEGYGGGVCQVSSTLFVAAIMGGLNIITRHAHSRPVPYVKEGMDAAVSYDEKLDLVFENPYEAILTIKTEIDNDILKISFVGFDSGLTTKHIYKKGNAIPFATKNIKSKFIKEKRKIQTGISGIPGFGSWVYFKEDQEVKRVNFASNYQPVPEIWVVPVDNDTEND